MQIVIRTYLADAKGGQPTLVRSLTCHTVDEALEEAQGHLACRTNDGSGQHFGNVLVNGHLVAYCDGNMPTQAYIPAYGQQTGRKYKGAPGGKRVRLSTRERGIAEKVIEAFNAVTVI